MKKRYIAALVLIAGLGLTEYFLSSRTTWKTEAERIGSYQAARLYHYPAPETGKWSAIYTAEFAKKHNLPADGISDELNDYISYMEVISVPSPKQKHKKVSGSEVWASGSPKQDCILNFLATDNHDISLAGWKDKEKQVNRVNWHMQKLGKPIQLLNADKYNASYRDIYTFKAIHSADLIPGYDYFSHLSFKCKHLVQALKRNDSAFITGIMRESVFGKYVRDDSQREARENWEDLTRFRKVIIPKPLLEKVYTDIEIAPEPGGVSSFDSIADIPKLIAGIPFLVAVRLGAANEFKRADQRWVRKPKPPPWPKDLPTHYKLEKSD